MIHRDQYQPQKSRIRLALLNACLVSWSAVQMLLIMAGLHDCKKTRLHFTATVSYLFPLECFQAPGLDQHLWIMDVLPSLVQGGSLLTLHVCQLGHTTLKQHYHNNTIVDSLTLRRVCNCKHLQLHLYDAFPQISKLGRRRNFWSGPVIGHFSSVLIQEVYFSSKASSWHDEVRPWLRTNAVLVSK